MKAYLLLFIVCIPAGIQGQDRNTNIDRGDPEYCRLKEGALEFLENLHRNAVSPMIASDNAVVYRRGKLAAVAIALNDSTAGVVDTAAVTFLHRLNVPLTVFVSGDWLDANDSLVKRLSADTTFEIENAGLSGAIPTAEKDGTESRSTPNLTPEDCVDEIELNARKIYALSHRKPLFYLPAEKMSGSDVAAIACYLNEYLLLPDVTISDAYSFRNLQEKVDRPREQSLVVLVRAGMQNAQALHAVITTMKDAGFSFIKMERLLN